MDDLNPTLNRRKLSPRGLPDGTPIRALLLDLDGTIADTEPLHFAALNQLVIREGVEVQHDQFRDAVCGRSTSDVMQALFPQHSASDRDRMVEEKDAIFRDLATKLRPMKGLAALLETARRHGIKTGVVTNSPRINAEFLLETTQVSNCFDHVVIGVELPNAKPHPLPYLTALQHFDLQNEQAIAFEDSLPGIQSAVAAGIVTHGLTTSLPADALSQAGAAFVHVDFEEFMDRHGLV